LIDVLVVDDSAFMRKVLTDILKEDSEINMIYTVSSGEEAIEQIALLRPDVVTMDVEMPGMDGIKTVKRIMEKYPTPIIMISAYTKEGAEKTIEALEAGAIDFVEKPGGTISLNIRDVGQEILEKIKIANEANLPGERKELKLTRSPTLKLGKETVIIIAASTGGPRAIDFLLSQLPHDFPSPIIVVQHMPPGFTGAFAKRLNEHCKIKVKEASDGDHLHTAEALIAPGGFHLELNENNRIKLNKNPSLHGVRPSADITMNSVADTFNGNIIGIILSGMGRDGSIGVRNIKRKRGTIIAQDMDTSVVHGMPKAALETGSVDYILPLGKIADKLVEIVNNV
jgi:two-component system chemotaxis response regulator CheB